MSEQNFISLIKFIVGWTFTSLIILLLCTLFLSCGQLPEGSTDKAIDCIDGCSKPTPSPTTNQNGCDITDIPEGAVITCNGRSVIVKNYDEDKDNEQEQPSLTTTPNPSPTPPVNTIIIYQCKKGKKHD